MFPSNRKSGKPIVVVLEGEKARKRQRRDAPERLKDMSRFAWILLLLQLAATPLSAQEFTGQVGRIDEALLGLDWYLLGAGEFPILPVEGVWVSVLDCGAGLSGSSPYRSGRPVPLPRSGFTRAATLRSSLECPPTTIGSASPWSRVKWNAHPGPARLSARSGLRGSRTRCCATCRLSPALSISSVQARYRDSLVRQAPQAPKPCG